MSLIKHPKPTGVYKIKMHDKDIVWTHRPQDQRKTQARVKIIIKKNLYIINSSRNQKKWNQLPQMLIC
jgi:hypothetical protein